MESFFVISAPKRFFLPPQLCHLRGHHVSSRKLILNSVPQANAIWQTPQRFRSRRVAADSRSAVACSVAVGIRVGWLLHPQPAYRICYTGGVRGTFSWILFLADQLSGPCARAS